MFVCEKCRWLPATCSCLCGYRYCDTKCRQTCGCASISSDFHPDKIPTFDTNSQETQNKFINSKQDLIDELRQSQEILKKHTNSFESFLTQQTVEICSAISSITDYYSTQQLPTTWQTSLFSTFQSNLSCAIHQYDRSILSVISRVNSVLNFAFGPLENQLVAIKEDEIRIFDCQIESWQSHFSRVKLEKYKEIPEYGVWDVVLESERLVMRTGGGVRSVESSKVTVCVDVTTGKVTRVMDMLRSRKDHTGIYIHSKVYLFGGKDADQKLKQAEYYDPTCDQWMPLPDMCKPRFKFNPVCHRQNIILAGGCDPSIESFDIERQTYRLLKVSLNWTSPSITVKLYGEVMVTVTHQGWVKWRCQQEDVVGNETRLMSCVFSKDLA